MLGIIAGVLLSASWYTCTQPNGDKSYQDKPCTSGKQEEKPLPRETATPAPSKSRDVYYSSCQDAPGALRRGDPGYRTGLDRDGDGVACEG